MKVVIQRVLEASVSVNEKVVSSISQGILALVGIEAKDSAKELKWMAAKMAKLRIFPDAQALMNLSIADISGELLCVSQFTLCADTRKGTRPGFSNAMAPDTAQKMYQEFLGMLQQELPNAKIGDGVFGADMKVSLVNDGPVTFILEK